MSKILSTKLTEMIERKRAYFQLCYQESEQINFGEVFGNNNPVYLEIGCGRGEFLVKQSLLEWQCNFVGVEMKGNRLDLILRQLDEERHRNVRLLDIYIDAQTISYFPAKSLRKIFIIQPDPWPKRTHHRRRLINHAFLDMLSLLLEQRGILEIQTDHEEYAHWILKHLAERRDFMPVYGGVSKIPRHGHIVTYFEEKKMREGFSPLYITYRKKKVVSETEEN
ncbi:MAG: tRNA (guanosine(46)-N7)-methyltransferase TrmB [Candidatus Cloacimonetes bacterium]|nr:tRNA (guanosine(46)-N7)-methyltransferase TrmB [Candidatus Cloacimonadota bacterium]